MRKNNSIICPYGDKLNDGIVQLSFSLPVKITSITGEWEFASKRKNNSMLIEWVL